MHKKRFGKTTAYFLFLSTLCTQSLSAKPKKSKVKEPDPVITEETASEDLSTATLIPLEKKNRSYFSKIDSSVLSLIEQGSPESITSAVEKLRKNESDYDESEKVLISIATDIMKIVWPSEKITWESFSYTDQTPYTEAIQSVKRGIFDSSTGNTDFLLTMLPAMVVLTPSISASDLNLCEQALILSEEKNPNSILVNYLMGVTQEKLGKTDKAQEYLQKAYDDCQNNLQIQLELAKVLRLNNKLSEASIVLNNVDSNNQTSIEVLKQNAYVAFSRNDLDSAEQFVSRVLQQTPNDLDFVLFRAKILIAKNDYIHAVSLLDMYARQNNTALEYLVLRAKVQLDWSKNTTAAMETVEKALQLYPDNKDALLIAASLASLTGAPVAGKYSDELAEKILSMDPDNKEALVSQLNGLTLHENWKQAYETCKKLILLPPVSSEVILDYVTICNKLKKNDEAFSFVSKAFKENPEDEIILQAYVLAYSNVGGREEVIKFIDGLMATASSRVKSNLYYRRSFLQKSEENKLADLRSSLIANPRNSESLFRLYEIYYDKQDYRKAQYYLRQVVAINPNDSSVKKLNEALTKLIK